MVTAGEAADASPPNFPDQRPAESIYDPAGLLGAPARTRLAENLRKLRDTGVLDMVVVLLPASLQNDPVEVATELANRWGDSDGRAVILYLHGQPQSPWIAITGRIRNTIPSDFLDAIALKARQQGSRAIDPEMAVVDAVDTLANEIRLLQGQSRGGKIVEVEKRVPFSAKENLLFLAKKLPLFAAFALALIALLAAICAALWRAIRWLKLSGPLRFPGLICESRLGAPHGASAFSAKPKASRTSPP
nr:TPM domain-containing protein [Haloferula luteola]